MVPSPLHLSFDGWLNGLAVIELTLCQGIKALIDTIETRFLHCLTVWKKLVGLLKTLHTRRQRKHGVVGLEYEALWRPCSDLFPSIKRSSLTRTRHQTKALKPYKVEHQKARPPQRKKQPASSLVVPAEGLGQQDTAGSDGVTMGPVGLPLFWKDWLPSPHWMTCVEWSYDRLDGLLSSECLS